MTGGRSPRARGDAFERLTRQSLEGRGWLVIRSAGSLGCADLVAFRSDHQPWFISCKATKEPYLRPQEMAALWLAAVGVNAIPVLAYKAEVGIGGVTFMALMGPERVPKKVLPFSRLDHR